MSPSILVVVCLYMVNMKGLATTLLLRLKRIFVKVGPLEIARALTPPSFWGLAPWMPTIIYHPAIQIQFQGLHVSLTSEMTL